MSAENPAAHSHRRAPSEPSRRGFVLGGTAAVLVAGGAGVTVAMLRPEPQHRAAPKQPPAALADALAVETELLRDLDRALTAASASTASLLRQLRADHAAHRTALAAAIQVAVFDPDAATPSPSASSSTPAAPLRSLTQLRAAEVAAARAAAAGALSLTGDDAALLASISACEASHAELLG